MNEILTVEEAADYLKVSKTTIRRWCVREQLPAFKIGREWRISKKELDRVIQRSSRGQERGDGARVITFE